MNKNTNLSNNISFRNSFINSYKLLNKKERANLKINSLISFFAGLFEIISVTTFYPLVSVIVDPNLIKTNKFIYSIWSFIGYQKQTQFVILLFLIALIVLIISLLFNLFSLIKSVRDASSAEERLSKEFYKSIIYSPYKWHILNNPNIIRNILLNDLSIWNKGIIRIIPGMAGQLAGIIFALIAISIATPKLGIFLIIISILLLYFLLKFIRNKTTKLMIKFKENQEIINIFVSESLKGIKDIKLSSNEEKFIKGFYKINHIIIRNLASANNWNSLPSYLVFFFGQLIVLLTALSFFILGLRGGELAAIMAVIVLIFSRLVPLFNKLGSSFTNITNYGSYAYKLKNSIDSLDKKFINRNIADLKISNKSDFSWGKVKFNNVYYSYPETDQIVVKNLNLEIKKGFNYAFVGSSGAGKSTIIDLFLGLLEPSKGDILIDKINLKNIGNRNWQKKISYVPQDPLISDLSLRENIAFGVPKELIDNERIYYCLKQTDMFEVSKTLKNGIYTNLGNEGITLSGGQKQRVAISRALYHRSEIIILDEATSSLDIQTEKIIQKTIQKLKNKMTVISIAHRFSTIKDCDFIFLIDKGEIKGKGSFEELMEESILFRNLSSGQLF